MTYDHPIGTVNFDFYKFYDHPVGTVDFAGDVPPEPPAPWYQIPVGISPGVRMAFKDGIPTSKSVDSSWGSSRLIEPVIEIGFSTTNAIEKSLDLAWKGLGQLYKTNRAGWKRLLAYDARVQALWRNLGEQDLNKALVYGDCVPVGKRVAVDYGHPPPKDLDKKLDYGSLPERDIDKFDVPWGNPPAKDRFHKTVWGKKYYEEICTRDYVHPDGFVEFNFETDILDVGTKDHINFYFDALTYDRRCKWREPSGWRDAYDYRPPVIVPTGLSLRTYIMMSTAQLNRLPDNLPIPVKSITMSLDWDSVHWSLAATVIGGDVRDLSPTNNGPIETQVKINGTTWNCLVDDWSRDVGSKGKITRGIRGRSLTAMLGAPWAGRKTEVQSQQRTARQLMIEQLENSGWTIDCSLDDWLLPAGTLKIDGKTPLSVVKRIAATAGGFVRPDPTAKTLYILPKYKVAPWAVVRADADIILPGAMVARDQGAWDGRANADVVHMVGSISVSAKRTGSAGTLPAPDVNDELLTEVVVARARSIFEIGRCGRWQKHSLSLPVFSDAVPGVIFPGQVIGVDDDTSWLGFVTAVSVKADWGKGGLVVRQIVHLEVYCGD